MSAVIVTDARPVTWRDRVNFGLVCVMFMLLPVLGHAGGLGIAPIAAIVGGASYLLVARPRVQNIPPWGWALIVFLSWASLTTIWSPYNNPDTLPNGLKLVIGVALFLGVDQAVKAAADRAPVFLRRLILVFFIAGLIALLYDILSGYKLTYLADPPKANEVLYWKNADILRNLGHAIIVAALMLSFMVGILRGHRIWRVAVIAVLILLTAYAAIAHTLAVAAGAIILSILFMLMAGRWPRIALGSLTGLAIFTILGAPLIGWAARAASPSFKASLPFSWEHRLTMWDYVLTRIGEHPIIGHGFDAVRTFNETQAIRGDIEISIVSLHPHNAGLHIWTETGLIGAILASIGLFLLGGTSLRAITKRPEWAVPLAGFAAAAIVISTVTYGVWQDWWWAALIVVMSLRHVIIR